MNIRPFFLPATTHLARLKLSLAEDLEAWAWDWFNGEVAVACEAVAPFEGVSGDAGEETVFGVIDPSAEEWVLFPDSPAIHERIGSLMLCGERVQLHSAPVCSAQDLSLDHGDHSPAVSLAVEIVRESFLDLARRVLRCDRSSAMNTRGGRSLALHIPRDALKPGRGVLRADIVVDEIRLPLWLPAVASVVKTMVATISEPLSAPAESENTRAEQVAALGKAVEAALIDKPVTAQVTLGGVDLSLGELLALRVGDVIRLDKNLHDPLTLQVDGAAIGFSGHLGQQSGRLVFQVTGLRS